MNIKLTCGYNNGKNIPYIAPVGLLSTDLLEWFFLKIAGSELYGSNTIDIDESYTYRVPMNDDSMHWCLEFEHVNLYASIRLPRLPCDFEDSAVL